MLARLSNAVLLRIDPPTGASAAGVPVREAGPAIAVPCVLAAPGRAVLAAAEAAKVSVTASLFVRLAALPAGQTFEVGCVVAVRADGLDEATEYAVTLATRHSKGSISHWQLGLEDA